MAEKSTFIKLDRNITEWGWYHDGNTFRVFVHLILKANIKEHKFENIVVHRGELVTSRKQLAIQLSLSEQQIRTALEHLKLTGEITSTSYSKFTVISIKNYDFYQSINQQSTSNQPASNQQSTSNQPQSKNDKNEKNEKNERNSSGDKSPEPPESVGDSGKAEKKAKKSESAILTEIIQAYTSNPELQDALQEFIKVRNKIKKPITKRGLKSALKDLDRLATTDEWKIATVDNAIVHCWHSFYETPAPMNGGNANGGNQFNFGTTLSGNQ